MDVYVLLLTYVVMSNGITPVLKKQEGLIENQSQYPGIISILDEVFRNYNLYGC
jgi:hypothetical protein